MGRWIPLSRLPGILNDTIMVKNGTVMVKTYTVMAKNDTFVE